VLKLFNKTKTKPLSKFAIWESETMFQVAYKINSNNRFLNFAKESVILYRKSKNSDPWIKVPCKKSHC